MSPEILRHRAGEICETLSYDWQVPVALREKGTGWHSCLGTSAQFFWRPWHGGYGLNGKIWELGRPAQTRWW